MSYPELSELDDPNDPPKRPPCDCTCGCEDDENCDCETPHTKKCDDSYRALLQTFVKTDGTRLSKKEIEEIVNLT